MLVFCVSTGQFQQLVARPTRDLHSGYFMVELNDGVKSVGNNNTGKLQYFVLLTINKLNAGHKS
jgi:hypothetical protein